MHLSLLQSIIFIIINLVEENTLMPINSYMHEETITHHKTHGKKSAKSKNGLCETCSFVSLFACHVQYVAFHSSYFFIVSVYIFQKFVLTLKCHF